MPRLPLASHQLQAYSFRLIVHLAHYPTDWDFLDGDDAAPLDQAAVLACWDAIGAELQAWAQQQHPTRRQPRRPGWRAPGPATPVIPVSNIREWYEAQGWH